MPIRGLLSQLTQNQVQLQVPVSLNGGITESSITTAIIAPSNLTPGDGFMGWLMDERGGPADGTGITNYLIWVFDGSLNGGNGAPRLFQSTDNKLQTWMEITLPVVLTHNVFAGGGPGVVWSGLRAHSSGAIVIGAAVNDNSQPGGVAVFRFVNGAWNNGTFADTAGDLFAGQLNIPLAEGDDGALYMAASSLMHAGAFTPASIVYKSGDGGVTWSKVYYVPGNVVNTVGLKYFTKMGAANTTGLPAIFAYFKNQSPLISKDEGVTWTSLTGIGGGGPSGSHHSFAARLSDGTYLVSDSVNLWHSTDSSGLSYQAEVLPSGFGGIEALASGDNFAWLVLDNDGKGPYLYKRDTDPSYHASLTGLLTLLDTANDTGHYYIKHSSLPPYDFWTQSGPTTFWGVDSLAAVTQTLFDNVKTAAGVPPAFWGRYIGFIKSRELGSSSLSQLEAGILHSNNCKVLLIYNDTYAYRDANGNIILVSNYIDGVFHATQAMNYISQNKLAVPQDKSVWIYLNTEIGTGIPVLPAVFYRGWLDTMLGSAYGGAGGVYGNTDPRNANSFNMPYCEAYNTGISFLQTDTQAGCPIKQYFGNPVGGGAVPSSGRKAAAGGSGGFPGFTELTQTMLTGESNVIYVLWEIAPGPNAVWRAGNWTVRLDVTSPSSFITWTGVEIVHVDKNCNGIEQLGNLSGQSVSLKSTGVLSMVVPGIAPASMPTPGDKVLLLLSFSNSSKTQSKSFGYTPMQLIDSPFARVGALLYANQPDKCDGALCPPLAWATSPPSGMRPPFSPTLPPCGASTVIYQYATNFTIAGVPNQVDYDLANGAGFASIW